MNINRLLSLGLYDRLTRQKQQYVRGNLVAAGNPEKYSYVSSVTCDFPQEIVFKEHHYQLKDYLVFDVSGDSMSPKGIYNADTLLVRPTEKEANVNEYDFIVIKVDDGFYKSRHNDYKPLYQYKLRMALTAVTIEMTEDEVCETIAQTYEEILLPDYKEKVLENLREAREYYQNEALFASVTYPEGKMHISFHAKSLIKGKVVLIGRREGGHLNYIDPKDLKNL